jgi:hypothetical protein
MKSLNDLSRVPDVRSVLAYLDEVLARGDATARDVWVVLTALRGPDDGNDTLKNESTAYVRSLAFPQTARSDRAPAVFAPPGELYFRDCMRPWDDARLDALGATEHFRSHIRTAMLVLTRMGCIVWESTPGQLSDARADCEDAKAKGIALRFAPVSPRR